MDNWQVPLYIQALAEVAKMESMKALNQYRYMRGESQAYDEEAFLKIALELETISRELRG